MKTIPDSLARRFCAVVDYDGVVRFCGRYDECIAYMRDAFTLVTRGLIDLYAAEKLPGGYVAIGIPMSYVL